MSFVIAAAQSSSVPGDISRNVAHHLRFAAIAAEYGVRMLIFPELSLTGYELGLARASAIHPDSAWLDPLRDFAARTGMTVVAGGPLVNDSGALHIAAFLLHPDGSVGTHTKQHVHESEQGVFTSGPGGAVLRIGDEAIALAICADASHASHAATAAARGASVYAAGAMITDDAYHHKARLLEGYAVEHGMAVLLANYSGVTGGEISAGKSAIWREDGRIVAASGATEEALVIGVKENEAWRGMVAPVAAGQLSSGSPA